MGSDVPALGVLIDLPLGIVMWCAIVRFLLSIVVKEDSRAGTSLPMSVSADVFQRSQQIKVQVIRRKG